MSTIAAGRMTAEEFFALPEVGMDRDLIHGELREKPIRHQSFRGNECLINLGAQALAWARSHRPRQYRVFGGDVRCRLPNEKSSVVRFDLAIFSTSKFSHQTTDSRMIHGLPELAVEIHAPRETYGEIFEKTQLSLQAGVQMVWIVDPDEHSVKVDRPGRPPEFFHKQQSLSGEPTLPGLVISLADIFELL